ncbi:rRNA maturation RNase YbeY [Ilumatobacter sp.]|uniref:rRNA maturation RNase YbeY n=1 Tax=Ilumatobacter sp. TaxID=1967498 RepID=UPI003B529769
MGSTVVAADARAGDEVDRPVVDVDRWARLAQDCLESERADGELTVTFVDLDEMSELNAIHMGSDGPTDVLSFPIDDEPTPGVPRLLGDVVVSPAVAERQFGDHAGSLVDEIALLVVHGVLHVLGHDHVDESDTRRMRAREIALLSLHHWRGPPPPGFRQTHA